MANPPSAKTRQTGATAPTIKRTRSLPNLAQADSSGRRNLQRPAPVRTRTVDVEAAPETGPNARRLVITETVSDSYTEFSQTRSPAPTRPSRPRVTNTNRRFATWLILHLNRQRRTEELHRQMHHQDHFGPGSPDQRDE